MATRPSSPSSSQRGGSPRPEEEINAMIFPRADPTPSRRRMTRGGQKDAEGEERREGGDAGGTRGEISYHEFTAKKSARLTSQSDPRLSVPLLASE